MATATQPKKTTLKTGPGVKGAADLRSKAETSLREIDRLMAKIQKRVQETATDKDFTWANLGDLGHIEQNLRDTLGEDDADQPCDPDDIDEVVSMAHDLLVKANGNAKEAAAEARSRCGAGNRAAPKRVREFWENVASSIEDHGNLPGRV